MPEQLPAAIEEEPLQVPEEADAPRKAGAFCVKCGASWPVKPGWYVQGIRCREKHGNVVCRGKIVPADPARLTAKSKRGPPQTFTLPRWGRRFSGVYTQIVRMRQDLRAAVKQAQGEVNMEQESLINAACRYEGNAKILESLINKGVIPDGEVPKALKEIGEYVWKRMRTISRVKLVGGREVDPSEAAWSEVDEMLGQEPEVDEADKQNSGGW